ncbi:hypothetical protein PYJP_14360 [Pyrofollis japonicus]|nr:hypothetical protein PYJP_14360 [Pyrofollis japonicus]
MHARQQSVIEISAAKKVAQRLADLVDEETQKAFISTLFPGIDKSILGSLLRRSK